MHHVAVQNLYSLLSLYSLSNVFQHISGQNMNAEAEENMSLPVHACLFVLICSVVRECAGGGVAEPVLCS